MAAQAEVGLLLRHLHGLDGLGDRPLLERFVRSRDEAAFTALVQRHGGMVLGVCRRLLGHQQDAEDCFQAAFLILARKAASIRSHESVGGWLHRVACRLALKARAGAARRRHRESQGTLMPSTDPGAELTAQELRTLVDEELQQLPDRYRAPVVLCYLEGKTQEEAAHHLGWSKGTLRRRLGQGRELLRQRLLRRGVAPALALAASLTANSATAVPAQLIGPTVRAALGFATGMAVTAGAERAAALAEGGIRTMFVGKMRGMTALLLLTVGIAAGMRLLAQGSPAREALAAPPTTANKEKGAATVEISGRVLDQRGKPVAGARVYFDSAGLGLRKPLTAAPVRATSAADGHFRFRIVRTAFQAVDLSRRLRGVVVAAAAGHGPGWSAILMDNPRQKGLTLKLAEEASVSGRALDLQGKPLAGITVRVVALSTLPRDGLKEWAEAFADRQASSRRRMGTLPVGAGLPPPVTTDKAGRFRLTGLGRDRLVAVRFEGPDIETCDVAVVTRPGPTFRVPRDKNRRESGSYVFHGDGFDHIVAPGRPVAGTVRAKDSGKALAGVFVRTVIPAAWPTLDAQNFVGTTTDEQGRYRLPGLSRGDAHIIRVVPALNQPYLGGSGRIDSGAGREAVRLDFGLKRGVVVHGRVTDKISGKPVRAQVSYFAFLDNPALKDTARFSAGRHVETPCGDDGSFLLVVLSGRGLLAVRAPRALSADYITGAGAEKIKDSDRRGRLLTLPTRILPHTYNTLVEINPTKDVTALRRDITLDPGKAVSGTVVGPDGKPVEGVRIDATWQGSIRPSPEGQPARFTLQAINAANPQPFFFYHMEKKLGAAVLPRGDEPKNYTVRLQPLGTLTGRILDEDGAPLVGAQLTVIIEGGQLNLTPGWGGVFSSRVTTDRAGRFRAEAVLPGVKCGAFLERGRIRLRNVFENISVKPGEVKDLGDIKSKTTQ